MFSARLTKEQPNTIGWGTRVSSGIKGAYALVRGAATMGRARFQDRESIEISDDMNSQISCDSMLLCDLTQSWSPAGGGGITTYLKRKREFVLSETPHRLLQIVPGPDDKITYNGRHTLVEIRAGEVWGSPTYRFIQRTGAVHDILARFQPDIIESLCPWVLPWTAINYRRKNPATALVAGYRTNFPDAHVYRVMNDLFGPFLGRRSRDLAMIYARLTYKRFDHVYTLNQNSLSLLKDLGVQSVGVLPLGVDKEIFSPDRRDLDFRTKLGLTGNGPLLIYVGRVDNEKRARTLVDMFRLLPVELNAQMVIIGDGKLRETLMKEAEGLPIAFPGFETDRIKLASALASSDIYVSAMADETFGISVIEAQASGLPVVGVASGAMPERVPRGMGLLGPVDDAQAMADNVVKVWGADRSTMRSAIAKHTVAQNSWEKTFSSLLDSEYKAAFHSRDQRRKKFSQYDMLPWRSH